MGARRFFAKEFAILIWICVLLVQRIYIVVLT
jgi:hypothetical protein